MVSSPAEQRRDTRSPVYADLDRGWAMTVQLVAATLTWGGIGWLLDRWWGSDPWAMVVGFVVGNAAGLYLIWVRMCREEAAAARPEPAETETPPTAARTAPTLQQGPSVQHWPSAQQGSGAR